MTRPDLLALTPDALAALANRGLVKRAAKELDAGAGPAVEIDADGVVRGTFSDGVSSALPPRTTLDAAVCSCGAPGVCRHRIALVLAYQRSCGPADAPPAEVWSPGSVTDDELVALFGEPAVRRADRTRRAGYQAKVRRPTTEDPTAVAELPTCVVSFLVPGDLAFARTDATIAHRDEAVVLAVWAFRVADELGLTGSSRFDVGGGPAAAADLRTVGALLEELLEEGAAHASPVLDATWLRLQRDLVTRKLHWPAAAIDDLLGQLDAYRARSAAYEAERFAELVTELHARATATGSRSEVLGADEPAETPLRRVRLTALGCRMRTEQAADVYFASGEVVLVHRDTALRTARTLAAANVVSESASRSASRVLKLKTSRVAKTSVTPVGTAWADLPAALVVHDLAQAEAQLAALPPRVVRARVAAELVRVVRIAGVEHVGYDPAAQRVEAVITDVAGRSATVEMTHRSVSPHALDALADALRAGPLHVSGSLRRARGRIVIDPLAVHTESGVVVPDLAGTSTSPVLEHTTTTTEPISAAVSSALTVLAEAAHRGLHHLPPSLPARLREVAAELHQTGLRTSAGLVNAFVEEPAPRTWLAAHLRLLVTAEFR
ncbi:hypothetical protein FKR81_19550 [Lentzea tibetensis]|uniref:SWIM-type domain-containing protein n=1 Tax=Lentzea tibetensis TaxID=2591470 RepID=A0A563ESW0_9PSEU|nr:hypothetical protein [Lentzea tibetensis]TWP50797.1 hypothetical protein FKR81_19550 [Lentzea tibetensis]